VENEYIGTVKDKKYKGVTLKNAWTINKKGLSAMVASFTAAICATFGNFDIVHFHAEGPCAAMWIPKIFGKKCVATVHGLDWQREKWGKGFASKYIKFGEKVMVKCADEIIVLSESAREYFKKTYNRDTVLIHNGIDKPNKKEADEITKIYGLSKDEYICIVSRLTAEKGVHYLIDAYNSIKTNKKLVIAGDTSDTDEYVELLKQKHLEILILFSQDLYRVMYYAKYIAMLM
jgi:glycosyltransferase involved in cell wall biosynthesis